MNKYHPCPLIMEKLDPPDLCRSEHLPVDSTSSSLGTRPSRHICLLALIRSAVEIYLTA